MGNRREEVGKGVLVEGRDICILETWRYRCVRGAGQIILDLICLLVRCRASGDYGKDLSALKVIH